MEKFDQIDFERKYYKLITEHVNDMFSDLVNNERDDVRKKGLQILRGVMASLHAITEESVMQAVYGLLNEKESKV